MTSKTYRCLVVGLLACWLVGLAACGGGGGNTPQKPGNRSDNNVNSNTVNSSINPVLPGKLFYQIDDDTALLFDFESGTTESIPNTNWESQRDVFPSNEGSFSAFPVRSGEQWTVVVDRCGLANNGGCMRIQDKFGNYIGEVITFDNRQTVLAQLSDDTNYVYMRHKSNNSEDEWTAIYDIKGKNFGVLESDNANMDWLPDNRLIIVDLEDNKRQFRFTSSASFEIESALELPRVVTGNGTIGGFEVSPDGKHIAFGLLNESEEKKFSIWTMEITTGALVRVAEAGENINSMGFPRWSPDGEYLSILAGPRTGLINFLPTVGSSELKTSMFILPLNKLTVDEPFIFSQFSDRSPEVIELKQVDPATGVVTKHFGNFGGYSWIE